MTEKKSESAYQVEDRELLIGAYQKLLWNHLVKIIPRRILPNWITVLGQFAAGLGVITAALAVNGRPYLYLVSAFLWICYLTADNIDGSHARRTGQTSVLGEFLDHGLDGFANGALLITAAIVLQMKGIWMPVFLAVGSLGFIVTFWEQYRTERLVLPELSSAEGITVVAVIECLAFAFGSDDGMGPDWLRFDFSQFNVSMAIMILVLLCYIVAIAAPVSRASKAGARPTELIQCVVIVAALCLLVQWGAPSEALLPSNALLPSIAIGLFGADVVCRLIRLRHRGEQKNIVAYYHWLFVAPPALAGLTVWTVEGWATLSVALGVITYARTIVVGGAELLSVKESTI
jgi:phosphatidylglycerophosphate synthase